MYKELIKFASPTLAGIKSGSIFTCPFKDCGREISLFNKKFNPLGIKIDCIGCNENGALLYVYRKALLKKEFNDTKKAQFISKLGYNPKDITGAVNELKKRLKTGFPHEIGLFLGYPLDDVKGFIDNKGKNYIFNGYWKVYCNEKDARACFDKYKKCTACYCERFSHGTPLEKFIVKEKI